MSQEMPGRYKESERLFAEALEIIPGGVTSARHPSKFVPGSYPIFMNRGKGSNVWDADGNEYIDWMMSFGPIVLGHVHPRVEAAVRSVLDEGFCFTMVHPLQNVLAKKLIEIVPCAEMVRYFTGGSDACSAAIRIARVHTKRDKVIRWGYHGWHDWCYGGAGTDREAVGVPESARKDVLTFQYNDLDSLEEVFRANEAKVACVIMQPYEATKEPPRPGFLEGVKRIAHEHEAVLIFDEIRSGFRIALGGAQEYFGVTPDMAVVSKAIANGYPISAVVGKKEVMECAAQTRLSATFFVNAFPMAAALATIQELQETGGIRRMWEIGRMLMDGLQSILQELDIEGEILGVPPLPSLRFTHKHPETRRAIRDGFFGGVARCGVIFHPRHCWFLSTAHTEKDVARTLDISRDCMKCAKEKAASRPLV